MWKPYGMLAKLFDSVPLSGRVSVQGNGVVVSTTLNVRLEENNSRKDKDEMTGTPTQ